jgi:riboflavin kinase/FMN adenylyltransferase
MTEISWNELPSGFCRGASLCIGTFDGMHRGHRKLLEKTVRQRSRGPKVAVVFRYPPALILRPESFDGLLTEWKEKEALFEGTGLDNLVVIDFSGEFSTMSAGLFLEKLKDSFSPDSVWIGENFRFGKERSGEAEQLRAMLGTSVNILRSVRVGEMVVSSTLIRRLIREGDVRMASVLLGRKIFCPVKVWPGNGASVIELGKESFSTVIPERGFFDGKAVLENGQKTGVSIGCTPSGMLIHGKIDTKATGILLIKEMKAKE